MLCWNSQHSQRAIMVIAGYAVHKPQCGGILCSVCLNTDGPIADLILVHSMWCKQLKIFLFAFDQRALDDSIFVKSSSISEDLIF